MGILSFISEWSGEANKIYESDKTIEFLTGINPKHLHPELYKNNLKFPHEAADGLVTDTEYGKPNLTLDEITALRLAMFLLIYDKHEEYPSAQKYADALGRLLRTRKHNIRLPIVHIIESDICYGLKTIDSNPSGEPSHQPQITPQQKSSTPNLVIREIDRRSQSSAPPQPVAQPEVITQKVAPPAFTATPKTVLSTKDREIINDLKLAGWSVTFNGKSWTFRKGKTVHEIFDADELRILANKPRSS